MTLWAINCCMPLLLPRTLLWNLFYIYCHSQEMREELLEKWQLKICRVCSIISGDQWKTVSSLVLETGVLVTVIDWFQQLVFSLNQLRTVNYNVFFFVIMGWLDQVLHSLNVMGLITWSLTFCRLLALVCRVLVRISPSMCWISDVWIRRRHPSHEQLLK